MTSFSRVSVLRPGAAISASGLMLVLLLLIAAPKAHTGFTQSIYPQSPEQLAQQLSIAIQSKKMDQIMALFNWEAVELNDVHAIKSIWLKTLEQEVLTKVEVIPMYKDFESESQAGGYYRYIINGNRFDSNLLIDGKLKISFKSKHEDGFSSTITMALPYGAKDISNQFRTQRVWRLAAGVSQKGKDLAQL